MSKLAIAMMVVSIVTVWGGLGLAVLNLHFRSPQDSQPE